MKRIAIIVGLALFAMPAWLAAQEPPPPPPPPPAENYPPPPPSESYSPPPPQRTYQPPADAYHENHGEIGVYADYFRFKPGNSTSNYVGVGARLGFNVQPNLALEAEMNYDFARNFTSTFNNGATTTFVTSSVRPLSGFFGPKLQFGRSSAVRAFLEGKIGFINFSTSNSGNVNGTTFSNSVTGVGGSGTHLAFFPGGGLEAFIGPVGLRLDVGDEVYLSNGSHNNLRVTLGPTIRF